MKPDPRFPNRPTHPDFDLLSEVVTDYDAKAEQGIKFTELLGEVIDPSSATYMAEGRATRLCQQLGLPNIYVHVVAAVLIDGLMMGSRFQQRRTPNSMECGHCGDAVTWDESDNTWVGSDGEVNCPFWLDKPHGNIRPDTDTDTEEGSAQ